MLFVSRLRTSIFLIGGVIAVALAAGLSLFFGSTPIPPDQVLGALFSPDMANQEHVAILELRGPRTVGCILVGAAFAVAGAIMQGMTAVFVAQLYNIDLTLPMIATIVIAATLGTIGSPGMPGVVMVTLTVVLQSVGFPLEAIAIIVAIDKFPDMFKTVLNVLGDAVDTVIVAKSEGEFDADVFNGLKEADVNVGE